jgi:hypothetical protein
VPSPFRTPMRQFISLLLVVSLSWVTTGYACRMDGLDVVRAVCCCPQAHTAHSAAETDDQDPQQIEDESGCCDVVASTALDEEQPGVLTQATALDLPVFASLPVAAWNVIEPAARPLGLPPPARGPPSGSGTRTYLSTARLRL